MSSNARKLDIEIRTTKGLRIKYDLLDDRYLLPFGKSRDDVKDANWTDHLHDSIYTELNLAGPHHPLVGSGSAHVCFKDRSCGEISEIFYQDFNETPPIHYGGLRHWNHERRYSMPNGEIVRERQPNEAHIIDLADWLEIGLSDSKGNQFIKKIRWQDKSPATT